MAYVGWLREAGEFWWVVSIVLISLLEIILYAEFGVKLILLFCHRGRREHREITTGWVNEFPQGVSAPWGSSTWLRDEYMGA